MRVLIAVVVGAAVAAAAAVVLGDYPLSGSVPWVSLVLIPLLIGVAMILIAPAHRGALWVATGPLAAASIGWGVRIATGWGLDPVPAAAWVALFAALIWPPLWALVARSRRGSARRSDAPVS